jgi:hypothetical protein
MQQHVYGFKVGTREPSSSGPVTVASHGFSVDVSRGPCPVRPIDSRDFTATTEGPVGGLGIVGLPPDRWSYVTRPCRDCYTTAVHARITGLAPNMRIVLSCHGHGCRFSRRSFTPRKRSTDLATVLAGSHLSPGTKVRVAITAHGGIKEVVTYTMQRGSVPRRTVVCLAAGSRKPVACGSKPGSAQAGKRSVPGAPRMSAGNGPPGSRAMSSSLR